MADIGKVNMLDLDDQEENENIEIRHVELPDWDDTQIVEEEGDEREIALFLNIKDGKVCGAETTPFIMPHRWTYDTLRKCVENYVDELCGPGKQVTRLYFKRAKGKSIVCLDSDRDIPSLLKEYPLTYPSGKRKQGKSCIMYLAVEIANAVEVRKSPRVQGQTHYDVFLHQYNDDGKVSTSADTLHNISSVFTLADIIKEILVVESKTVYLPQKGLYWLRKGTRQTVVLKTDDDLNLCRREYSNKSLRIACSCLDSQIDQSSSKSRKRKLDMNEGKTSTDNELWNDVHVSLVQDLEKKGVMWRYNINHLKVWTDLVVDGKLAGIGEEPKWEDYLEIVKVPPKSRRTSIASSSSSSSSTDSSSLNTSFGSPSPSSNMLELMLLQNQQRMEMESHKSDMFQATLLALITSNNKSAVSLFVVQEKIIMKLAQAYPL